MRVVAWPAFANKAANPYNYLLYSALIKKGVEVIEARLLFRESPHKSFQILHLHWPEYPLSQDPPRLMLGLLRVFAAIAWAKLRGAKVVWTVHNLRPHEETWPSIVPLFYKILVKSVDGSILLSQNTIDLIKKDALLHPLLDKPYSVIPHGHYRDLYPIFSDYVGAKRSLGLSESAFVFLFFGQVRPYKGIEQLIDAFKNHGDSRARLLIAGKPLNEEYASLLREMAKGDSRILFLLRYFPDEDLPTLFAASDAVVLPYASILNSGSVFLALSQRKPVLAPKLGSIPEIAGKVGEEWLMLYEPPLSSQLLEQRILTLPESPEALDYAMEEWNWNRIAQLTLEFYRKVLRRKK